MVKRIDTIIIYKGDELSLWKKTGDSYSEIEKIIPTVDERYIRLKDIVHISARIRNLIELLILQPEKHKQICHKLQSIHQTIACIENKISEIHADDRESQLVISSQSKQLLKSISLLENPISKLELNNLKKSYIKNIKTAISHNNKMATEIQRLCLYSLMDKWESHHNIIPKKCRIVIVSTHGARVGRIEAKALTRWIQRKLNRKKVVNRWLYSIGHMGYLIKDLDCKKDIIEGYLLPTEANRGPAKDMLGHSQRMNADVLSPYFKDGLVLKKYLSPRRNRD